MSINSEARAAGGVSVRQPDSNWVVSMWYIPGSCDYHNAQVVKFFFVDKTAAESFSYRWSNPPEMADCYDLADPRVNELFPLGATA